MKKLALIGSIAALAVAAGSYPALKVLESTATDAYIIAAKSPELVKDNKESFDPREPKETDEAYRKRVMGIYGNPIDYTTPVLFVPKEKFIRPPEAPELILLPVDKEKGENPLQVKSLYFFAKPVTIGSAVACLVLFGLSRFLGKRAQPPAAAA
ncbi:MAG TPA: hypothetical protein VJB14_12370 [Planctomycetota bacterium]|nr:hypothetical protein [Planctomycetota bacterium]